MKLTGSVGVGGSNLKPDVYLVEWALSEVEAPIITGQGINRKTQYKKGVLWSLGKLTGEYSVTLSKAIKRYQSLRGVTETGKIFPIGKEVRFLTSDAPRIKGLVTTTFGIIRKEHLITIRNKNTKLSKLLLLEEPLFKEEGRALSKFVEDLGRIGLEIEDLSTRIDGKTGRFRIQISLSFQRYVPPIWEKLAFLEYHASLYRIAHRYWVTETSGSSDLKSIKSYDVLRPLYHRMKDGGFEQYGINPSKYNANPNIKVLADAFTRIQVERKHSSSSFPDRAKLLSALYPLEPNAARTMMSLTAYGRRIGEVSEIFPLYGASFKVGGPIAGPLSVHLKAQLILNPNNRKEYLYMEMVTKLGLGGKAGASKNSGGIEKIKPTWILDGNFEIINKSILDYTAGGAQIDAKASGAFSFGGYEVNIQLHPKPIKESVPRFFNSATISTDLDRRREASKKFVGEVMKWDMGLVEISLKKLSDDNAKLDFSGEVGTSVKQHVLFNFDADIWDEILYNSLPDINDLREQYVLAS